MHPQGNLIGQPKRKSLWHELSGRHLINRERRQKAGPAFKNLPRLQALIYLAEEVGARLGERQIL